MAVHTRLRVAFKRNYKSVKNERVISSSGIHQANEMHSMEFDG